MMAKDSFGKCEGCGKDCYRSRKAARTASKKHHPGDHMRAYECLDAPEVGCWHYGHDESWRHRPTAEAVVPAPPDARAAMHAVARATKAVYSPTSEVTT